MNILLVGCSGKMGLAITNACEQRKEPVIVCGLDIVSADRKYPVYTDINDIANIESIDVVVDFSHPNGLENTIAFCSKNAKPLVYATTGLSTEQIEKLDVLSKSVAVFRSANMSVGVNLLIKLAKQAAEHLYGDYDIEIIEKHHNQKIDAPSGTALMIADGINEALDNKLSYKYDRHIDRIKRPLEEIGIHTIRGGSIVGAHEVIFAGHDELITLSHEASSKEVFAQGAIKASLFIKDKGPGMYNMDDMLHF